MLWKVRIFLNNLVIEQDRTITLSFSPLYKYKDLYVDLAKIIGLKRNYRMKFEIVTYKKYPKRIKDLDTYILNRDTIDVTVYDSNIILYRLEKRNDPNIITTSEVNNIYREIKLDKVTEPLLIYEIDGCGDKIRLYDVIDNPQRHLNAVITRLVKRYDY